MIELELGAFLKMQENDKVLWKALTAEAAARAHAAMMEMNKIDIAKMEPAFNG